MDLVFKCARDDTSLYEGAKCRVMLLTVPSHIHDSFWMDG